ncbi:MAG: RNA 2',3'-cyclic phosphodiesterase [Candidatus Pacearchaeota archaeon]|nr:RNA 2',3'-cyclic phosphodiesterase [Candidatus Pacearchaeota archaeon]
MRTFISIDIPEKIKKEIIKIQNQLSNFKGKLIEFKNLHLTLKFLGEIDEKKLSETKKRLKNVSSNKFEAEIDSIGVFSEDFIKIIWLRIRNCDELQKQIDEKLRGIFKKEDRFMSHLTIARVKNVKDKKKFLSELNKMKILPMKFTVNDFNLKKSTLAEQGPVYDIIENYRLN